MSKMIILTGLLSTFLLFTSLSSAELIPGLKADFKANYNKEGEPRFEAGDSDAVTTYRYGLNLNAKELMAHDFPDFELEKKDASYDEDFADIANEDVDEVPTDDEGDGDIDSEDDDELVKEPIPMGWKVRGGRVRVGHYPQVTRGGCKWKKICRVVRFWGRLLKICHKKCVKVYSIPLPGRRFKDNI